MVTLSERVKDGLWTVRAVHGEMEVVETIRCRDEEIREQMKGVENRLWELVQRGIQESWSRRWTGCPKFGHSETAIE